VNRLVTLQLLTSPRGGELLRFPGFLDTPRRFLEAYPQTCVPVALPTLIGHQFQVRRNASVIELRSVARAVLSGPLDRASGQAFASSHPPSRRTRPGRPLRLSGWSARSQCDATLGGMFQNRDGPVPPS
jgi:hypothetical protein